jgi:hypothetical protein
MFPLVLNYWALDWTLNFLCGLDPFFGPIRDTRSDSWIP